MKRFTVILSFVFLMAGVFSCTKRTDLSTLVPNEATGVGKVNLPSIKSKVLTWELVQEYLFSESGEEEHVDWAIDLDREAFFYTTSSARLLIPVTSTKSFEKAITTSTGSAVQTLDDYKYVYYEKLYICWKGSYVVVSPDLDFMSEVKPEQKSAFLSDLEKMDADVTFSYDGATFFNKELKANCLVNFEEGNIRVVSKGDLNLHEVLKEFFLTDLSNIHGLDKEYSASLNVPLQKQYLSKAMTFSLPILQANGLLFQEQYNSFSPYLDGRVQFGLEKEPLNDKIQKAQLVLGTTKGFAPVFDSLIVKNWVLDHQTGFYKDLENFQCVKLENDLLILSNSNTSVSFSDQTSLFSFDITREAIKDDYLLYPKILFGAEAVDLFPIHEVLLESSIDNEEMSTSFNVLFTDRENNSLVTLFKYLTLIQNRDEI